MKRPGVMLVATALMLSAALGSYAQGYPSKPIRMVVPFAPGGNVDITARTVAPGLGEALGQQVLVENRPGAGGTIATAFVAKAPPDGYTILMASSSVMTNGPALYPKLPYDITRDLTPIGRVSVVPLAIVVHPSVPAKTTRELIAVARAQGGNMLMANAGIGTTNHLIAELFMIRSGARMNLIPYKGSGPALSDLVAGHVFAHVDQISSALPFIQSGRIRAIAVTTAKRAAALPAIPTLSESGVPGFDASTVTGILAPATISRETAMRLNAALVKVLGSTTVRERFSTLGAEVQPSTAEELGAFIREDLAQWVKVVKQAGIKIE
jgi:tripartite-type tricarboxylate transporter receptor subunit TctC